MSECQQPGDIEDHIGMLVSAVESAAHDLAGAGERTSVKECEGLLKAEIDAAETRAYAEGRKDEAEELASVLPGPYYMDPPDGGSVTVLEQLQRMAEDARKWREQEERIRLAILCELRCEG